MTTTLPHSTERSVESDRIEVVARRLAAVGEPTRLRLVLQLRASGTATVQDLAFAVGSSLPNVSKHLRVLHEAGLVARNKEGTYVRYGLTNDSVGTLVHYAVRVFAALRRARR